MPNQYTALTAENIQRKINRKRNPVRNISQLAKEFGRDISYVRATGPRAGHVDTRPPSSFVKEVKALIGERAYNRLRDSRSVNKAYR